MNRKKRKASCGRATKSNQKDSAVPSCDAVEVGEMVTVEHVGTSVVDLDENGEQVDYLEMAWLLREKLNDFVEGGKGGPVPGLELRSLLEMAASRKIISVDSRKMSPVLWRNLPKELLVRVLARLPLPDITRLCSLSKEWNQDMVTVDSEINRALDEMNPTMVAGVSFSDYYHNSEFLVTICDLSSHRPPYSYRLYPGDPIRHENRWDDMGARDGGLVCFVSTWEPSTAHPLCVVVVNLLTRVRRKLPPLQYVYSTPPKMMDIKVDSATKCYRVVVVGRNKHGRSTVETYDSGARQWIKGIPPLGFIFGNTYSKWHYWGYDRTFRSTNHTRSVYDFAERRLKRCDSSGRPRGVTGYELQKDCVFVLHKNTANGEFSPAEGYCITKYRMLSNAKDWVLERSYSCSPFEGFSELDCRFMNLEACEGFLLVFPDCTGNRKHFCFLDLSSGEWSSLPDCFEEHKYGPSLTRASWNVVP